jgi:hypothetical protein
MTYSYEFTQKAEEDLEVILDYLTKELKNQQAAKKFLDALHECLKNLLVFPESGERVRNPYLPAIGIRRKIIGHYIIYYAPYPKERKLRIIRLGHGLQDQAHLFMDLKSH